MRYIITDPKCTKGRITINVTWDRIEFDVLGKYCLSSPKALAAALLLCDEIKRRMTKNTHGLYTIKIDTKPDTRKLKNVPEGVYEHRPMVIVSNHYVTNGYGVTKLSDTVRICSHTTEGKSVVYKLYNISTSDAAEFCKNIYKGEDIAKISKERLREDLGHNNMIVMPV